MSNMRDFALYEKLNDLSAWLFPVVDRFPRTEKFALCTQIKNSVHSMVRHTIRAQKSRDKLRWLFEVDVELEVLRHFIRHAFSRRYLSARRLKVATE
ncbi:diversity-generating retroelement protein Avd [Thiohalophilus sp.]|uniref:diversity-generating retroelement protein Avd n=1 Tax=Thiohalophilus sp. TaxID=3028392 RepID=UPI002ACE8074|nr:diversity-generating retroelement protein Avd [Thiohalophilus sp.]MDZ7804351.1 diversity-generating retroelement protein Avd [Thiohalophilus sp.]